MARVILVNEHDDVVAVKELKDRFEGEFIRASALWLTNSKGEILMAKRAPKKKNDPNVWGPAVAGTVEEGETYESNIFKETVEEIGLTLDPTKLETGPKMFQHGSHKYWCQWYFYSVDMEITDFIPEPLEVSELRWVTKEDLLAAVADIPRTLITASSQFLPVLLSRS